MHLPLGSQDMYQPPFIVNLKARTGYVQFNFVFKKIFDLKNYDFCTASESGLDCLNDR